MKKCIVYIGKRILELLTKINPKLSNSILYIMRTHEIPHYKNPKNFNDETSVLKMYKYPNNELVIKCTDKYEVRKYIEELGYSNILNELYGVYSNPEEIDFNKLPNKFALKCTHGCAYNIICSNKKNLNIIVAKEKLNKFMRERYGLATTELHYLKIKPRIICEKYLCDKNGKMPIDYKVYCFNGKAKCILVCSERDTELKLNMFDLSWNELPYIKEKYTNKKNILKPQKLEKMIKISEDLSKPFPFVRVDLYNDNGKIIFGELTFTPACCANQCYSKKGNNELLKMFNSNNQKPKIGIIGHFGGNKKFTDGQTVKTKEICNYLEKYYDINIDKVDTYYEPRNLVKMIIKVKKIISENDVVILIVSSRGYKVISPILYFFNKKKNKKVFDIVIGGVRYNVYDNNIFLKKVANSFTGIFVETLSMKKEYEKRKIKNVKVLPNFKNIELQEPKKYEEISKIKICTFTRIVKEKGIEDAIDAVKLANKKIGKDIFTLDLYGRIDNEYIEDFEKIKQQLPNYIKYKGEIDANISSKIINEYDLMLFLTFWKGEGFPGTLIDTLFACTPCIATDWNCNFEVLTNNETGIMVSVHDVEKTSEILIKLYNNPNIIEKMSKRCQKEAKEYMPDKIMKTLIIEIEK